MSDPNDPDAILAIPGVREALERAWDEGRELTREQLSDIEFGIPIAEAINPYRASAAESLNTERVPE